jgi:hypothetical protein
MFLSEMFNANNGAYQDLSQDDTVEKIHDLRKTRLTLAQINQLRKMNDQRTVEYVDKMKLVKIMYAAPAVGAASGL